MGRWGESGSELLRAYLWRHELKGVGKDVLEPWPVCKIVYSETGKRVRRKLTRKGISNAIEHEASARGKEHGVPTLFLNYLPTAFSMRR
jgi:hypothetical protein